MGETLKPDGSIDFSTTGVAATGAVQTDEYVCAGDGAEEWSPRFTYHGFRYLELSGAVTEPIPRGCGLSPSGPTCGLRVISVVPTKR